MRLHEINSSPRLYVDMDGVQADFFTAWANKFNKAQYKDIGDRDAREASIVTMNAKGPQFIYDLFRNLEPLPGGMKLIKWISENDIPYIVLSSPLRGNEDACIGAKKEWLDQYVPGSSSTAIFDSNKQKYAKHNGIANILIDDFKANLKLWDEAGGISILYREHLVDSIIAELAKVYKKQ